MAYTNGEDSPENFGKIEIPKWLNGYFLISEANLSDPHFHHTVVLIISHDKEGAFGLVLNRKLDLCLGEVVPEFAGSPAGTLPLFQGGPVQQQVLFTMHSGLPPKIKGEHASTPVEQVIFEPAFPILVEYLKNEWASLSEADRPPVNLYAGYSGWAQGQLEFELEQGAWVIRPAAVKYIFSTNPEENWREALGELGGMFKIVAETGFKPSMN